MTYSQSLMPQIQQLVDRKFQSLRTPINLRDSLYILDKQFAIIPFRLNKAQAHYAAHRTGRDLILKARQLGISTLIQAENFVQANERTTLAATLAHDDKTTQKLRRMADRFWEHLPDSIRPKRGLDNATTTTYPATGSEVMIVTAGSGNTGRGGTYNRLHGSEVAYWKDADALLAGIMQGVPTGGVIELESTPNGAVGWFYEHCMEALDGDSAWTLHFYAWWWDTGYCIPLAEGERFTYTDDEQALVDAHGLTPEQIKWRRDKVRELGIRLFTQEYPEDVHSCFLTSGDSYFGDIDLTRVLIAKHVEPSGNQRIVGGLDFAQASDYTVLSLGDAATTREVHLRRMNRMSWGDMRARIVEDCVKWNVTELLAEKNSMGTTNIEELHKELASAGAKTRLRGFDTTPKSKPSLITGFHWGIDEGGLELLPDPVGRQELLSFVAKQSASGAWQYEAKTGHDDTVIARALLYHLMNNPVRVASSHRG